MLEIKFWSTCVKIASQLAVCLFVEMLFLWRQYLIFVIKDSLPTHVILWWFIDGVVFLILEIDSTQDPSRLTTKILALLNLCACHFSMSRVFFMCVCACVCAWWKTPSQCCLNGHAVLWQPDSQLLCSWSKHYRGTESSEQIQGLKLHPNQMPAYQSVSERSCIQSRWSISLTHTHQLCCLVNHLSWVWWSKCRKLDIPCF